MKVMVMVKATPSSEAGVMPSEELIQAMTKFNEDLVEAGILLGGDGLKPSKEAVRIRFSGDKRTQMDGPFADTKELVAGYWLWQVESMDEAIAWVKKCPNPMLEDSDIDIRPIIEFEDFGEAFTPELQEKEAALLAQTLELPKPSFEDSDALTLIGIEKYYSYSARGQIGQQWEEFLKIREAHSAIQANVLCYGVCTNTSENGFYYLSGMQLAPGAEPPEEFALIKLMPARYAVFKHEQHISSIAQTMDIIWSKWVINCGLKIAQAPCFERYTENFDPITGYGGTEVWIPLLQSRN